MNDNDFWKLKRRWDKWYPNKEEIGETLIKDMNSLISYVEELKKELLLRDAQVDQYKDILHDSETGYEKLKEENAKLRKDVI